MLQRAPRAPQTARFQAPALRPPAHQPRSPGVRTRGGREEETSHLHPALRLPKDTYTLLPQVAPSDLTFSRRPQGSTFSRRRAHVHARPTFKAKTHVKQNQPHAAEKSCASHAPGEPPLTRAVTLSGRGGGHTDAGTKGTPWGPVPAPTWLQSSAPWGREQGSVQGAWAG